MTEFEKQWNHVVALYKQGQPFEKISKMCRITTHDIVNIVYYITIELVQKKGDLLSKKPTIKGL